MKPKATRSKTNSKRQDSVKQQASAIGNSISAPNSEYDADAIFAHLEERKMHPVFGCAWLDGLDFWFQHFPNKQKDFPKILKPGQIKVVCFHDGTDYKCAEKDLAMTALGWDERFLDYTEPGPKRGNKYRYPWSRIIEDLREKVAIATLEKVQAEEQINKATRATDKVLYEPIADSARLYLEHAKHALKYWESAYRDVALRREKFGSLEVSVSEATQDDLNDFYATDARNLMYDAFHAGANWQKLQSAAKLETRKEDLQVAPMKRERRERQGRRRTGRGKMIESWVESKGRKVTLEETLAWFVRQTDPVFKGRIARHKDGIHINFFDATDLDSTVPRESLTKQWLSKIICTINKKY